MPPPDSDADTPPLSGTSAPLRVVFFGPKDSGKSSLMTAFEKVASVGAEEEPVPLSLDELPSAGRIVIRRKVKVDLPDSDPTAPFITLIDCDGGAAGQLLRDATALTRPVIRNELLDALRSAEALVVTVDATDTLTAVNDQMTSLRSFIEALRAGRTFGREIGGLPVFLTLTKCDKLYEKGMTPDEWVTAIERQKAVVHAQYVDALGGHAGGLFGDIELELEATAAKVPPVHPFEYLSDDAGAFRVQNLLRNVLNAASSYAARRRQAKKRLGWTVSVALGLFGLMLAGFVALALTGEPGPLELLTARVRQARTEEGPPAVRLADRNIDRNRKTLEELRASPHFAELPSDLRKWAADRDREYGEYGEHRKLFQPPQFSPADVRTAGELAKLTADLTDALAPPVEYAKAWEKTEAVRLRDKWQTDRDLLVKAEAETHDWYRNLITRSSTLMNIETPDAAWRTRATALLTDARTPPVNPTDPIPGSPTVPIRRGDPLKYAAAYDFERTDLARQDWEFVARKLADLRDLSDALGLTVDPTAAPPAAPLDLPEPTADPLPSLSLGAERWKAIRERFPRAADGTANWSASYFPDPVKQTLARRARAAAETALRHVRRMILFEVKSRPDTPADWPKLAGGLLATPEMQDWSRLVQLLLKCADIDRPTAALPVAELAAFVRKTSFEWSPMAVELFLPAALLTDVYAPAGNFTITVTPDRGNPRLTIFGPAEVVIRTPRGIRYRLPVARGSAPLVYRPGEKLTAELPVKTTAAAYKLQWTNGGTASYQFDRLTREPQLVPADGGVAFTASGVKLGWTPAKESVTVPELLPEVK